MLRFQARLAVFAIAVAGATAATHAVPMHPAVVGSKPRYDYALQAACAAGLDAPAAIRGRLPARVLVLLVDFPDRPHASAITPESIDARLFGTAATSLRSYYQDASFARLHLQGQVTPWLRLPETLAFYADAPRNGDGVRGAYPRNARRMVEDALAAADAVVDWRLFDDDGPDGVPASGDDDSVLDALLVVHAGDGAEFGIDGTIVSHSWTTVTPVRGQDGIAGYRYATVAESSPPGVIAHEYGHVLGLPDAYDRLSTTRLGGGLGDWSLMASGAWLGGGHAPGDLDAASKLELGFVDAQTPVRNGAISVRARNGTMPPDVYRLWTHGAADLEYLVIENRQRVGRDALLPGAGLLVYHVDRRRAHNDDLARPRVVLLQGDGLEEIDRRINNGDAEDPLPSRTSVLDATTTPSTRRRDGADSQLRLRVLSPSQATMQVELQVETTPRVRVATTRLTPAGGGAATSGDTLQLQITFANDGVAAEMLQISMRAQPAGDVTWMQSQAQIAHLAADDSACATFDLLPEIASARWPYGLQLIAACAAAGGWRDSVDVVTVLGDASGFQACLEPPASALTRDCSDPNRPWEVVALSGAGTWTRTPRAGEWANVWRSAAGVRYANRADAVLVSPPFRLAPGSELRLLHAIDSEDRAAGYCADGGRVELALDGGDWQPLRPHGGYPRRLWPEGVPQLAAEGVFGGAAPRRWDRFDLGDRGGVARVRFRFASDDSLAAGGWEIARVEVGAASDIAATPHLELIAEPNPLRFPARLAFRITAPLTFAARPTTLAVFDVRGRRVRLLAHPPVPAQSGFIVWDGTDRAGRAVPAGVYFARLDWGATSVTRRVVVVR